MKLMTHAFFATLMMLPLTASGNEPKALGRAFALNNNGSITIYDQPRTCRARPAHLAIMEVFKGRYAGKYLGCYVKGDTAYDFVFDNNEEISLPASEMLSPDAANPYAPKPAEGASRPTGDAPCRG